MYGLQEIFERTVEQQIESIKKELLAKKFRELGIRLNKDQLAVALSSDGGNYQLDLSLAQLKAGRKATGRKSLDSITIDISDTQVQETASKFSDALAIAIPKAVGESADFLIKRLRKRAQAEVSAFGRDEAAFQRQLLKRWKRPLQLFEVFIAIVKEAGERFHFEYAPSEDEGDFVYEVVIRLHARACHIASEVITLLKSGFPDGAHARWRTIHEVVTVALFIQKHGPDTAERYMLHETVETFKGAEQFQTYCKAIGDKPFPKRTMNRFRAEYESVIRRFGRSFGSQYGWAAVALSNQSPKFADLEKDIGLDRFRPYYRMASQNVHATTKGITHKLGLLPWFDILLLERSDVGLADPLHGTAISLQQVTSTLMTMKPTIDLLTLNAVLTKLQREIGDESLKSQKVVEHFYEEQLAKLLSDKE
jgi:hypothetical protein